MISNFLLRCEHLLTTWMQGRLLYPPDQHPNNLKNLNEFSIFPTSFYSSAFPWGKRPRELPSSLWSEVRELTIGSQAHDSSNSPFSLGLEGLPRSRHRIKHRIHINPANLGNVRLKDRGWGLVLDLFLAFSSNWRLRFMVTGCFVWSGAWPKFPAGLFQTASAMTANLVWVFGSWAVLKNCAWFNGTRHWLVLWWRR